MARDRPHDDPGYRRPHGHDTGGGDGGPPALADADVMAFLRARPDWLAAHPELYHALTPPARVHGEALADHMVAMLEAARAETDRMAARADAVVAAGRASAGLAARVNEAVLALLRTVDPMECLAGELPGLLAIDSVSLCVEAAYPNARHLPRGAVDRLMQGRDVVFRADPADAGMLHGEAASLARCDALIRLRLGDAAALVALAARDAVLLDPLQGTGALAFLGRAIAAALTR